MCKNKRSEQMGMAVLVAQLSVQLPLSKDDQEDRA